MLKWTVPRLTPLAGAPIIPEALVIRPYETARQMSEQSYALNPSSGSIRVFFQLQNLSDDQKQNIENIYFGKNIIYAALVMENS